MHKSCFSWLLATLFLCLLGTAAARANGYEQFSRPLAWSPDASVLAAAVPDYWEGLAGDSASSLQLIDTEGSIWVLNWGKVASPAFSSDGEWLAAVINGDVWLYRRNPLKSTLKRRGIEEESYDHEVYDQSMPYRHVATLTSSQDVLECAWQGSEALLISRGERFYGCGIERISWPRQDKNTLSANGDGVSEWGMALAPGGRLAYSAQGPGIGSDYERLCTADPAGMITEHKPVAMPQEKGDWGYHEAWPLWEDETRLLFQRGGWGDWSLYGLDTASGEEQLAVRGGFTASSGGSGRWLAFNYRAPGALASAEYDWELPSRIVLADRSDRGAQRYWAVSAAEGKVACPALSADGSRLAWLAVSPEGYVVAEHYEVAELLETSDPLQFDPLGSGTHFEPFTMSEEASVADEITYVVLETGRGEIVLECHRAWAPLGYARFLELVRAGYYDGAPWFRVIPGFVAQTGIAADPAINAAWDEATIKDDPVIMGNKRAFVSFGTAGPDTRTTHIFINYSDNSRLDGHGFSAFAQVSEGMDVADSLTKIDDNAFSQKGLDQGVLAEDGGLEIFRQKFPGADYILRAYVRE